MEFRLNIAPQPHTMHFALEGLNLAVFLPESAAPATLVYLHASEEMARPLCSLLEPRRAALVAIDGEDWNRDLSPWPAQRVFHKGGDFAGGANPYLQTLLDRVIPQVEAALDFSPARRMLAGYSLAGLFAVYAVYRTDAFDSIASVSGSLWFDGFDAFLQAQRPVRVPQRAYFSVGDREKQTKNPRMARVEAGTAQAAARFEALGAQTRFELNPGNHFADSTQRLQKALAFLLD